MRNVNVMITAFRDGFQSAYGARVRTEDFLPALEAAVDAGFTHFEIGGGARFQSLYFYCNEDAFEMMDACRRVAGPEVNLQTLARGVNVVGLDSQPSDIIAMHANLFAKHGVSTIRNFDALNDVENLDYSGRAIADAGLNHEVCVTLMGLPPGTSGAHDAAFYTGTLRGIIDSGIPYTSVCYKDASGTATPATVYESIKEARRIIPPEIPLRFHTHETAGTSVVCYKAALEAGADGIDLSLAPVSGGTAQPDVVAMWHALRGTEFNLDVDIKKVLEAEEVFKDRMREYFLPPEASRVEPMIPFSPMPGGALTANTQMMRDNGILDRYPEIIAAMGEVVARGGFGTSVTPVSQFYFQQAFNNVMFGPWMKIAEGYGKMVLGYFGRTPQPADPEIVSIAADQLGLQPTTESARVINDRDATKGRSAAEERLRAASLPITDENVFIAATCLDKGITYLKGEAKLNIRKRTPQTSGPRQYRVTVDGVDQIVTIDGDRGTVGNLSATISVFEAPAGASPPAAASSGADAPEAAPPAAASPAGAAGSTRVVAPMPGVIIRVGVSVGQSVRADEPLLVLEAMKMESEIHAPSDGVVASIGVASGDQVQTGDVLVTLQ